MYCKHFCWDQNPAVKWTDSLDKQIEYRSRCRHEEDDNLRHWLIIYIIMYLYNSIHFYIFFFLLSLSIYIHCIDKCTYGPPSRHSLSTPNNIWVISSQDGANPIHYTNIYEAIPLIDPCFNQTVRGFKQNNVLPSWKQILCNSQSSWEVKDYKTLQETSEGIFQQHLLPLLCFFFKFGIISNPNPTKKHHPPTKTGGSKYGAEGFRASF